MTSLTRARARERLPASAMGTFRKPDDALAALILLVVLTSGIPSVLVVHALGAAGTPAGILGDLLLIVWSAWRVTIARSRARNPVHIILFTFSLTTVVSYLAGTLRPISSLEISSGDRALLSLAAWAGITLTASDGLATRDRLDRLLRVLIVAGGLMAVVGYMQFFLDIDVARHIRIAGLTENHQLGGLYNRSGFRRISGTALHAIEFGAVLSAIVPVGLHYAMRAPAGRRFRAWWPVALMLGALPLTVSRSAVLGLVIVLVMMSFTWTARQRRSALLITLVSLPAFKAFTPHLLGTLKSMFLHAGQDPSVTGRTEDYTAVGYYFVHSPVLGRGLGTFLPQIYRTLDNQYLGTLVEGGVVGLLGLITLLTGAVAVGFRIRRISENPQTRSLAYALSATFVVAVMSFDTFDALGFPLYSTVLFLLLGCLSALWRLTAPGAEPDVPAIPRMRWRSAKPVTGLLLGVLLAGGVQFARSRPPGFEAVASAAVFAPSANVLQGGYAPDAISQLLVAALNADDVRRIVKREGLGDYEVALGGGSVAHDTDVVGTGGVITVSATGNTSEAVAATAREMIRQASAILKAWQDAILVALGDRLTLRVSALPSTAGAVSNRPTRAELALVILAMAAYVMVRGSLATRRADSYG